MNTKKEQGKVIINVHLIYLSHFIHNFDKRIQDTSYFLEEPKDAPGHDAEKDPVDRRHVDRFDDSEDPWLWIIFLLTCEKEEEKEKNRGQKRRQWDMWRKYGEGKIEEKEMG